ncbi:hypothetical protein MCEL_03730 [Mycolicibacterium celeriflavum]|uniref:Uncharacterized protein n=1 Tax=Mycolicibacterium celeriflavum TaxID=1249101 RepID=A0A7I7RC14_MYCCF|nr:hypothetical protein MCEL_03730 [Mycolicibacterium celeriflavum]
MQRLLRGFEVQEAGVEPAEPLHAPMLCPAAAGVRKSTQQGFHHLAREVADWGRQTNPGTDFGLEDSTRLTRLGDIDV